MALLLSVGLVGLVVAVAAPPVWLFIKLSSRFSFSGNGNSGDVYLFLYHSYNPRYSCWEALKLLQILGLVCVKVFGVQLATPDRLSLFLGML